MDWVKIGGGAWIAFFLGGMYHSEGENQSQIQLEEEGDVQKAVIIIPWNCCNEPYGITLANVECSQSYKAQAAGIGITSLSACRGLHSQPIPK